MNNTDNPVKSAENESSRDIYYKIVWPAVLKLRVQDPAHWYDKVPALYAEFKKQYGDELWNEIMKHGRHYPQ